jgi:hypothetical protein
MDQQISNYINELNSKHSIDHQVKKFFNTGIEF